METASQGTYEHHHVDMPDSHIVQRELERQQDGEQSDGAVRQQHDSPAVPSVYQGAYKGSQDHLGERSDHRSGSKHSG
jgi:hypothetical protein